MQKGLCALFCIFVNLFLHSQINLIPNPSFEDSLGIPDSHSQFSKCKNWYSTAITPDYFSVYSPVIVPSFSASVNIPQNCLGYQKAKDKNFYAGIFLRVVATGSTPAYFNSRESIGIKLIQPLIANHSYSFTLYYSLAEGSHISTNQLTAYFSVNQFTLGTNLYDTSSYFNYLPSQINHDNTFITDTLGWTPLTGCFLAEGGEEYLTIGNFKDALHSPTIALNSSFNICTSWSSGNNNVCYIYIDDVSLYDMGLYFPATCKNDTLICNGTSLTIGNNIQDSSIISWNPAIALSCTNCPNPIASPTTTTLYYLNKSICGANSKDSILVKVHTPNTTANAGADKTICFGDYILIGTNDSTNFTSYNWEFNGTLNCTNCAMPFANPTVSTTYTVQRTECASITTDTVRVIVDDCEPTFTVPNVFTPNYDDVNDTWGINFSTVNSHIKNFKMSIYDRWGLEVYSTNSVPITIGISTPNSRWDGHTTSGVECSSGVYYYIVTFEKNDEHILLKGHLSLFR